MNKINRFLWFCSGVHIETNKKIPTEQNKYAGIGATIFFTALFAALSGGYAMYFVFSGGYAAPLLAVFFGIIWGLAIFNMDRYIVSSINKNGSWGRQILQATPRILLAIMIGIVISRPLELKIFDKEIRQKLKVSYMNSQRTKLDSLNNGFNKKYTDAFAKVGELKSERDSLEKGIERSRYVLNQEIFGDKTNQTSGREGYGTYARMKDSLLSAQVQRLDTVRSQIAATESYILKRKDFEGVAAERMYTGKELDSLANVSGFADRNWALGQLAYNQDGTKDAGTAMAVSFIALLFIFFECLPVFVKLMSDRGPYDIALLNVEEAAVYGSHKNRDKDVTVMDAVQDTRVEKEIELEKRKISRLGEDGLG